MKTVIYLSICCAFLHLTCATSTSKPAVETTAAPTATSTNQTSQAPTTKVTTQSPASTTPQLTPAQECEQANGSCDSCVKVGSVQCVWCASSSKCLLKEHVIPMSECGGLSNAKWAVCWVNYEALIIACAVIGGVLILALTICICCCCCCKKNNKAKFDREDAKYERKKAEMKASQAERRAERKQKTDEIRRKYGLIKDDTPYTRFDDAAKE